jgi:small subunit ribosomal protein S1
MKGQHLQLKVVAVDRARNHLLLTQRLYTKEEQEAKRLRKEQLLQELRPGDVRRGIVTTLSSTVVIIDIEGVEAHLFRRRSGIKDAGEGLQIGQEIEVMVLATDGRSVQVSQAHAQARDEVLRELQPGQTRTASICCLSSEGVYVDLGGPIGFIPTAQAVHGYITHPADRFARGQQLVVQIEQIDDKKNVLLSLVDH